MTNYRVVSFVVPGGLRDTANAVTEAMGKGPMFSIACSPSGNEPATHYAGHDAAMVQEDAAVFDAFPDNSGTVPEIAGTWGEDGLPTEGQAKAACAAMITHVTNGADINAEGHMAAALAANTPPLKIVQFSI